MGDNSTNTPPSSKDRLDGQDAHQKDLFEDVGKKVEGMGLGEPGFESSKGGEDQGPQLVDEIESYCMNCGENACFHMRHCDSTFV